MTLTEYTISRKLSKTALNLVDRLAEFSEGDDEFIIGVLVDLKTDEEREKVIRYIDEGKDVNYESIILFSLAISQARKLRT